MDKSEMATGTRKGRAPCLGHDGEKCLEFFWSFECAILIAIICIDISICIDICYDMHT